MTDPVLHLLAGPNGSGKTTLYRKVIGPATGLPFINADDIATQRWPGDEVAHAYDAAEIAAVERGRLIAQRSSFVTETVFSHPSKVELVQDAGNAGFLVHLHVVLVPEALAVARVVDRVQNGGHDVPESKVRERYKRLWPLVRAAIAAADQTTVYDNSKRGRPFHVVARYAVGKPIGALDWPPWTPVVLVRERRSQQG